jgi:hypothetical protein
MEIGEPRKKAGRHTCLTLWREEGLLKTISCWEVTVMSVTTKMLRLSVYNFCVFNKLRRPFCNKKGMTGREEPG